MLNGENMARRQWLKSKNMKKRNKKSDDGDDNRKKKVEIDIVSCTIM